MEDQGYQELPSVVTWTPPGEIDGEPHEVRDLTVQQLREISAPIAALIHESVIQIRNAGITGRPGRTTEEVSLETWLASDEGQACRRLIEAARSLVADTGILGQRTT